MTHDERLAALRLHGYTPRQAAFLTLVLLHSGHFLRRHYFTFLGVVDGARTTDFLQTLITRHVATQTIYWRQTHVYHLSLPCLYAAIGQENSRHRRAVEPAALTQKLMTLDVIIAHRTMPCLATEREKVTYFTEACHVPAQYLPRRVYRSERAAVAPTTRYFVDRVPVLVGERTTFVYVPGWDPLGGFAAFLRACTPLIQHLRHVGILFCTADQDVADRARRACEVRFPSLSQERHASARRALVLAHFRARRRFEARDFRSFTQSELEALRQDLERYSGPSYEQWYERWCREGDVATPCMGHTDTTPETTPQVRFDVFHVPFGYPVFGRIRKAS